MARNTYLSVGPTRSTLEWQEWSCPFCNTRAVDDGLKAPKGWYRCPACERATPQHQMDYRVRGILVGDDTGTPITIRLAGTATDTASATTVTVPNVSAAAGEVIVVVCCHDGYTVQGNEYLRSNIAWGSITTISGEPGAWQPLTSATTLATQTTISTDCTHDRLTSGGTHDVVVTWSAPNPIPVKKCVVVAVVSGLTGAHAPEFFYTGQAATEGNDTTPIGGTLSTRRANSIVISAIATVGPSTDDAGTWTGGFRSLARIGTTTGSDDRTVDVGYLITNLITSTTSGKSGITSRLWLVFPVILDKV